MTWILIQNSLVVAFSTALAATLLGVIGAVSAAATSGRVRTLLIGAAIAAFALPPFLVTNTWLNYFGLTGLWRPYVDFNIYSIGGTILILVLQLWPIAFLLTLSRLLSTERAYLEQDMMLGGRALFRYLLWPVTRGSVTQAAVLIFVLGLNNFAVPALLQTKAYAAEVWLSFNTGFNYAEALHLSWPLVVAPFALILYLQFKPFRLVYRTRNFPTRLFRERVGGAGLAAGGFIITLVFIASLGLPLFQLVSSARTWSEFFPAIAAGHNALLNSFLFAGISALLVMLVGMALRKREWPVFAWILFLVPGVLLSISLIFLFNRPGLTAFYQSIGIVLVAYTLRFLALGWNGARASFGQVDRSLLDAARVAGANGWQRLRLAEWPQARKTVLAAAFLVYLFCLWDVETLIFVVPPGRETLALRIFNMLHYGHASQVDALCIWLLIVALAPLAGWLVWMAGKRAVLSLAVLPLLVTGCSPDTGSAIRSDLFASVQVIGSRGTGAGQFNKPRSLAVDREDNLYVVDLTGRVQKFSPEGQFLLSWQMPQTDKGKPKGMLCDADGNIIVIEPHYSRVNHFQPSGKLAFQWGEHGTNSGQLVFPRAVAINSRGEIYVSEYGMFERVQHFSKGGAKLQESFGRPGTGPAEFNRPEGLGISPDDRVYVADSCNHRIQIFSPDGTFLSSFGKPGSGPGELSYPYDVRIDSDGTVFVCDFGNSRIQVFDREHQPAGSLGGSGVEPGQMNNPWSIALDSRGNLYVADSGNHRVQKFIRKTPLARSKPVEVTLAK